MSTYSDALREAYATSDVDDVILHTLEFNHSTFPEPVRVVNDFGSLLEAAAEYGGLDIYGHQLAIEDGTLVDFVGMAFDLALPEQSESRLPEIQIKLQNAQRELSQYLDAAVEEAEPITLIYREYLLSAPQTIQFSLTNMSIHHVVSTIQAVTMRAVFKDLHNRAFPNKVYRPSEFPGLVQ